MLREIVRIEEDKCDGCGLCVPACPEGALQIVDGKARLVSDRLCDGLGACLGECPRGAITIEKREAEPFDETALHPAAKRESTGAACPGSQFAELTPANDGRTLPGPARSELGHWPVQLRLLSPLAPVLHGARLLVCADCVPFAYANFHADLLRGHAVVVACPKLDDTKGYVEKLDQMIVTNGVVEITVAHMEVPCCTGLLHMVLEARKRAGSLVPVRELVIGIRGEVLARRTVPIAVGSQRT